MRINRLFPITTLLVLSGLSPSLTHSSASDQENKSQPDEHLLEHRDILIESNRSLRAMLDEVLLSIAKQVDVHDLDKGLGSESLQNWVSGLATYSSNVTWEWNDCGESVARRPEENYPVCVQVRFEASSNEIVGINIQIATEKKGVNKPQIWMIYVESSTGSIRALHSLTELKMHLTGADGN